MTIHDWATADRPREKMMANGAESLSDTELLAILISTGQKGLSAVDIAKNLLTKCHNSLIELSRAIIHHNDSDSNEMLKGIGPAKLCILQAAFELGRRKQKEAEIAELSTQTINNSKAIFVQFNQLLSDLDHEELWALYMSKNGKILSRQCISIGGVDCTSADVKKIVRPAIEQMASFVALCHNHPHSSTRPSKPDRNMTESVKSALALFDIRLLDHVVIADGKYYSFADHGEL